MRPFRQKRPARYVGEFVSHEGDVRSVRAEGRPVTAEREVVSGKGKVRRGIGVVVLVHTDSDHWFCRGTEPVVHEGHVADREVAIRNDYDVVRRRLIELVAFDVGTQYRLEKQTRRALQDEEVVLH